MCESNDKIISIFHEVGADIPGKRGCNGALIVGTKNDELTIVWREYAKTKKSENYSIVIKQSDLLNIMINHQEHEGYLLITSKPSNMYQFTFPSSSSYQLINFVQMITLYQHMKQPQHANFDTLVDFSVNSYLQNSKNYCLFDMSVEDNKINLLPEFCIPGFEQQFIPTVKPDLYIISQFGVKSEQYTINPITSAEFDTFTSLKELRLAVKDRGIEKEARHLVWPILFNVLPFEKGGREEILKARTQEYLVVRSLWEKMSKQQMKYCRTIIEAFATIRVDVQRTQPSKEVKKLKNWDDMLVSILRTFSIWNHDVRYTQGLNDLALNFLDIFVPYLGSIYSQDTCEALTFWCFAAFVEFISSGLISENMIAIQDHDLKSIFSIIEQFHPACAEWLRANKLDDLTFMISSYILAYGRSFETCTVARIWESLVSVKAPWLFMRYFSASLIILSFPSFIKIPNCSSGKLVSLMDNIFYNQDVGAVIGVSLSMMKKAKSEVKAAIRTKEVAEEDTKESPFFQPNDEFDKIYRKYPNLFL